MCYNIRSHACRNYNVSGLCSSKTKCIVYKLFEFDFYLLMFTVIYVCISLPRTHPMGEYMIY